MIFVMISTVNRKILAAFENENWKDSPPIGKP